MARELEPDDEMMVVLAGARTQILTSFTRDGGELSGAIDSATPSDCRGSLREALALSMSLSREKQNTHVYVLSDGATPEYRSAPEETVAHLEALLAPILGSSPEREPRAAPQLTETEREALDALGYLE